MIATGPIAHAYDEAAPWYDAWVWQTFWDRNEIPLVRASIAHFAGARRAVDIGTGTGRYLSIMREQGLCAYGLDASQGMLSIAAAKLHGSEKLLLADACAQSFAPGYFDLAIAARVLCHIPNIESLFHELARTIVPGGGLIVTELDHEHDFEQTCIPTPQGAISIKTWKRSAQDLIDVAAGAGWRAEDLAQISAGECAWLPDDGKLASIDRAAARPVFNVITLRRN